MQYGLLMSCIRQKDTYIMTVISNFLYWPMKRQEGKKKKH